MVERVPQALHQRAAVLAVLADAVTEGAAMLRGQQDSERHGAPPGGGVVSRGASCDPFGLRPVPPQ